MRIPFCTRNKQIMLFRITERSESALKTHHPLLGLLAAWCALPLLLPNAAAQNNPAITISVDANYNRRAINPNIYGVAYGTTSALRDLNAPLHRLGGNNTSRYNWQINADNRGSDWYFESIGDTSAIAGERGDSFFSITRAADAHAMLTIPLMDWVARLGANRSKLSSFSIARYGPQTGSDWQWFPDAGNGISAATGKHIMGNDPNDANVPSDSLFQQGWVNHLVAKWGTAANGGVKYYIMDNEPSLWFATHRDVAPTGLTMQQLRDKVLDYAGKIKASDPTALVVGPEEWGWSGYFYSGYDQQYGNSHGWGGPMPDRAANGNWNYLPWLLDQLRQNHVNTGKRLLDVFSVHYYPQGGEFSDDTSNAMQLRRNRSTRSLWDARYVDETWIGTQVRLIPRLRNWVDTFYPGTQIALTEYNWGAEGHINGATAQADIYGIFGREGLDMGARWVMPAPATPTYKAMKMYRNYDGNKSTFGDVSVAAFVPNPDNLAAFAAQRTSDGALTIMVISKYLSGDTPVKISLLNFSHTGNAQVWQLTSENTIKRLSDNTIRGRSLNATVPAQSITLFVLPRSATPAPAFASTASVSPSALNPGQTATIAANITCVTGALTNGIANIEVYDPSGTRVGQKYWTGQNFTANQTKTFSYSWTAPTAPGNYTLRVAIFGANWQPNYYWKREAQTITVNGVGDTAQYNFENGTQSWASSGGMIVGASSSADRAFAGTRSLKVDFNSAQAGMQQVYVGSPSTPAGKTVTFHVWIPAGSAISAVQPYILQGAAGGWAWTGNWQSLSALTPGVWNTITVSVPSSAATPLYQLGIQFTTSGGWTGSCYVDTVGW